MPRRKATSSLLLKDTTGLNDTLTLKYRKSKGNKASGLSNMRSLKSQPPIIRSLVSASHHYFDTLWLAFENPIEGICKPWLADSSALDTLPRSTFQLCSTFSPACR